MQTWLDIVKTKSHAHVSLHFDGIRVDDYRSQLEDNFAEASSNAINAATQYAVNIVEKQHRHFFEAVHSHATSRERLEVDDVLLEVGNCIPHFTPHERVHGSRGVPAAPHR